MRHLLPKLADLPREAEYARQSDRQSSTRVAELGATLAKPHADAAELEAAIHDRDLAREWLDQIATHLAAAHMVLDRHSASTPVEVPETQPALQPKAPAQPAFATALPTQPAAVKGGLAERILKALAMLAGVGIDPALRQQVALMAGYSHLASKGFANTMGTLRSNGLIDYPETRALALTLKGRGVAPGVTKAVTDSDLHARLFAMLANPSRRILEPLIQAYPKALPRPELGMIAGYGHTASKGFANAIGRLRSLKLIDYPASGQVAATKLLFLGRNGRK